MKKKKEFSVSCLSFCLLSGLLVTGSISSAETPGPGAPPGTPSNYIIGDIHSNNNYMVALDSGQTNLNIVGDVSAVGTATVGPDANVTSTQSSAAQINIPVIDFTGLQAANGQTIGTKQIMYIDGDVSIDLSDIAAYQNKTVVATGNITVIRAPGSHQTADLTANLIARGSIDIDLHGCGSSSYGITGFIFAAGEQSIYIGHDGKGDFTGINLDFTGCGHSEKSIQGIIMAKNGSFQMDIHGGGDSDSGVLRDISVTNDLMEFFDHLTYWREIRG